MSDFWCPFTGGDARMTYVTFFTPKFLEPLHDHPALDVGAGFGAGIPDIQGFDIAEDARKMLTTSEDFKKRAKTLMTDLRKSEEKGSAGSTRSRKRKT